MQLSPLNIDLVSNHPFYSYLTEYSIRAPLISGDNCSLSMYCDRDGYSLVVLDSDSNTNFDAYAADAFCEIETRTWMADFADGMRKFKRLFGVCINLDPNAPQCAPEEQKTILLGISAGVEKSAIGFYLQNLKDIYRVATIGDIRNSEYGFVRFDVQKEEPIEYLTDPVTEVFVSAIDQFLMKTNATSLLQESDALKVIERFLNNTQVSICGARITLLMTRPVPPSNTKELVAKLRKYRILLYAISLYSEEFNSNIINDIATQTYGYGSIVERYLATMAGYEEFDPLYNVWQLFSVYAVNVKTLGPGQMSLPKLTIPIRANYIVVINGITRETNVNITCSSTSTPGVTYIMPSKGSDAGTSLNTLRVIRYITTTGAYDVTLNSTFVNPQTLYIRFYISDHVVNDWVSYDNVPIL